MSVKFHPTPVDMKENDMSLAARREGGRIGGGGNKNYHLIFHFVTFLFFSGN